MINKYISEFFHCTFENKHYLLETFYVECLCVVNMHMRDALPATGIKERGSICDFFS